MHQFLVEHAQRSVWCSPRQDNQWIFEPARVTHPSGALNRCSIMDTELEFPTRQRKYHVFVIGQLDPQVLGLLRQDPIWLKERWFRFSEAMEKSAMEVTLYNADGINFSRYESVYMFLNERTMVVAVPEIDRIRVDYSRPLYLRVYSNDAMNQPSPTPQRVRVGSRVPLSNQDILAIEERLRVLYQECKGLRVYVNGWLVDTARMPDLQLGDFVEYVADDSFVRRIELKLSDLHKFHSTLDQTYKYLIHYPGDDVKHIEFHDDIDIHVVHRPRGGFERGVYYNRNQWSFHRMLTHRDYAIYTQNVDALMRAIKEGRNIPSIQPEDVYIQLYIRRQGFERPLVFENSRIFELYKLEESYRVQALCGLNAVMPEWHAPTLEQSWYAQLMGVRYDEITLDKVEAAYGYNACSKVLAETPQRTELVAGEQMVRLPVGLHYNATMYEYDVHGRLLEWHPFDSVTGQYVARNRLTRLVEGVVGIGGDHLDTVEGQDMLPMPEESWSYRVYQCYLVGGIPNGNWVDITGTPAYEIVHGKLRWAMGGDDHWLQVRSDKRFIAYDYEITDHDGLLNFSLLENPTGNPMDELESMQIPLAQLDVYFNDNLLEEDLEYFVEFPKVYITTKVHLKQPVKTQTQKIHVRFRGLPSKDLQIEKSPDVGFVLHNTLSNNARYDVRDDKVLSIGVGGRVFHRSDLHFGEDRPPSDMFSLSNGKPYHIRDLIVPMRCFTFDYTEAMRSASQELDQRVSDYMTEVFGPMESKDLAAIPSRYPVVSPFLSHLLHLLSIKAMEIPFDKLLDDKEVLALCRPHEGLLAFDPLHQTRRMDERFTVILPHGQDVAIELGFQEYRFFGQVVALYAGDTVDYSKHVVMTNYQE